MPTTRQVDDARAARQRRQRRHYGPHNLGDRCPICGHRLPAGLNDTGGTHPTCTGWPTMPARTDRKD